MLPLRTSLVIALAAAALAAATLAAVAAAREAAPRVVSLSPAVTATLIALGAEGSLVGVDDTSARLQPSVRELPRVGGLFNPSLEAIVALGPDFVALVPSAQQRGLRERLDGLGIDVLALPNIRLEDVVRSIEVLGERVGRGAAARARADAIRAAFAAHERARGAGPLRAVLVLQRDPLYVVGGGSFLDAMLRAAGAENAAARFDEPYPRVSVEWLIAAEPRLILDAADPAAEAAAHWARWPSLAAGVRTVPIAITLPGPHLDRSLAELAAHVRGGAAELASEEVEAP